MNKDEFLLALYDALRGLPIDEIERSIAYYREMIDERVEDGMSEEEAVAEIGSVEDIARQAAESIPITTLVREKVTGGRRKLPGWEIVLLVLGFPLWFPLALTAIILLLTVYLVIWLLVAVFFLVPVVLAVSAVLCVFAVFNLVRVSAAPILLLIGMALICAGLVPPLLLLARRMEKGIVYASKAIWLWVKSLFVRKGEMV